MFEWLSELLEAVSTLRVRNAPLPVSLAEASARYEQSLQALSIDPKSQLDVLLARDQVEHAIQQHQPISFSVIDAIGQLDTQLKSKIITFSAEHLVIWRDIIHPTEKAWWWWGDKKSIERVQQNNLPWEIAAGTIMVLSAPLALDILKRFWDGAPDTVSILGTLVTLLLTASPLVKQGQNIVTSVLKSVFGVQSSRQPKVMTFMAGFAFLVLLLFQQWVLPYPTSKYYNNLGMTARAAGNIQRAETLFQRAVALNPDRVVPHYNVAEAYQQIGFSTQAKAWYEKAIESDASFAPAYRGLGQVYNEPGDYSAAERIFTAGLQANFVSDDDITEKVTKYELLANLGWSYFGLEKFDLARSTLTDALALEPELKIFGDAKGVEYRLAIPHYYLAQIYEQLGDVASARLQWEESLRFLDLSNWQQRERYMVAQERLQALENK